MARAADWSKPTAAIESMMEHTGLSRRDLEPAIGSRGRMSEVLGRHPLTLAMVRARAALRHIPAEVLVQLYPISRAA